MKQVFLVILTILAIIFLLNQITIEEEVRVYDCGMAEWHPDIPKEVKNECRRLRQEKIRKQQNFI